MAGMVEELINLNHELVIGIDNPQKLVKSPKISSHSKDIRAVTAIKELKGID